MPPVIRYGPSFDTMIIEKRRKLIYRNNNIPNWNQMWELNLSHALDCGKDILSNPKPSYPGPIPDIRRAP
jgi:hypothetical protein